MQLVVDCMNDTHILYAHCIQKMFSPAVSVILELYASLRESVEGHDESLLWQSWQQRLHLHQINPVEIIRVIKDIITEMLF